MTEQLENIRRDAIAEIETEQRNIKLSLVRDCMNTEKLLFAHYPETHKEVITNWYGLFCHYYDMPVSQLEVECASLQAKASAAVRAFIDSRKGV